MGDYLIQQATRNTFLALRGNPLLARSFLWSLQVTHPDLYQEAVEWFSQRAPTVMLSWPEKAPDSKNSQAIVAVTLGDESEAEQVIGSYLDSEDYVGADGVTRIGQKETDGGTVRLQVNITVFSPSANLTMYVAKAVWWGLRLQRQQLEQQSGLTNQRLRAEDIGPDTTYEPDFIYRRNITFSADYPDIVEINWTDFVTAIGVTADSLDEDDEPGGEDE